MKKSGTQMTPGQGNVFKKKLEKENSDAFLGATETFLKLERFQDFSKTAVKIGSRIFYTGTQTCF